MRMLITGACVFVGSTPAVESIDFGGTGFQVRDCLHARDLVPLVPAQVESSGEQAGPAINVAGGPGNCMPLAQLSAWCARRYGSHGIVSNPRRFDVPWLVLDTSLARERWGWQPTSPLDEILDEIAEHAERDRTWLNHTSDV